MGASRATLIATSLLLLCTFAWGSVFPVAKHTLDAMDALTLALWRFVLAAACLLAFMLLARVPWPHVSGAQLLKASAIAIVGAGGLNLCLFTGLQTTSAMNGALIMALSPAMTTLLATVVNRQWPGWALCTGIAISFCGVALVITDGRPAALLAQPLNHGDTLLFIGMLCWSFYTLASQRVSMWMPMVPFTLLSMIAGAVTMGLACWLNPAVAPFEELLGAPLPSQAAVVYIGLFGTVAGYLLWLNGIKDFGPARAALFLNCVPVFSALVSELLGQPLTPTQVMGMVVVLSGLTLPALLKRRHQPTQSRTKSPVEV